MTGGLIDGSTAAQHRHGIYQRLASLHTDSQVLKYKGGVMQRQRMAVHEHCQFNELRGKCLYICVSRRDRATAHAQTAPQVRGADVTVPSWRVKRTRHDSVVYNSYNGLRLLTTTTYHQALTHGGWRLARNGLHLSEVTDMMICVRYMGLSITLCSCATIALSIASLTTT